MTEDILVAGTVGEGQDATQVQVFIEYDGRYVLRWYGPAGEMFAEMYHSMSVALARMALLAHCAENEYARGFDCDPHNFERFAEEMFAAGAS